MKKTIIIVLVIILVIGGVFVVRKYLIHQKLPYEFVIAEKRDIVQEVSATGQVSSLKSLSLQFKIQGKIADIFVKVGDEVIEGQNLIKLDTSELEIQSRQASANLDITKAQRDKTLAGASTEEIQLAQTEVKNDEDQLTKIKASSAESVVVAETTLANAEQSLIDTKTEAAEDLEDAYEDGQDTLDSSSLKVYNALNSMDDIKESYFNGNDQLSLQVKDKIAEVQYSYDQYKLSQSDTDSLLKELKATAKLTSDTLDFIRTSLNDPEVSASSTDKTTIDTERTNIKTALTNITTAQQLISSTKLTGQINTNDAEATLKSAQDNLKSVKAKVAADISKAEGTLKIAQDKLKLTMAEPRQADIDLAEAKVREAQAALALIQNKIKDAVLSSPIEARVTEIKGEVGEITAASHPVIKLLASNFQIEVDIPEADIAKIEAGDLAEIALDAFFGEEWGGKVVTIDPAEKNIQGVVYYKVTVVFDEADLRIKSGMTANVIIKTDKRIDVMAVPYRAIVEKEAKKIVRILDKNGEMEEREVETGLMGSEGWVEVISGVSPGDKIITFIKEK